MAPKQKRAASTPKNASDRSSRIRKQPTTAAPEDKRKRNNESEKASRKRERSLKKSNVDLPETPTIDEIDLSRVKNTAPADYHMMIKLLSLAQRPVTSSFVSQELLAARGRGIRDAFSTIDLVRNQRIDVQVANDHDTLNHLLTTEFERILIPNSSNLLSMHQWSISELLESMGDRTGQAYDGNETRDIQLQSIKDLFSGHGSSYADQHSSNLLHIQNFAPGTFTPDALRRHDLLYLIKTKYG